MEETPGNGKSEENPEGPKSVMFGEVLRDGVDLVSGGCTLVKLQLQSCIKRSRRLPTNINTIRGG